MNTGNVLCHGNRTKIFSGRSDEIGGSEVSMSSQMLISDTSQWLFGQVFGSLSASFLLQNTDMNKNH